MIRSSVSTALCVALLCSSLMVQRVSLQEPKERHTRVGEARYWTLECFTSCYKTYLGCIGKIFPPKRYNNEQMVELFRDKTNGNHELIEACSAQYEKIINLELDEERNAELKKLNETVGLKSNFDLCVFTECGAGGYYGSFNINHMKYTMARDIGTKKQESMFDFYFEMNSV